MADIQYHAIKTKKNERWLVYKQTRRDLDLCGDSIGRYCLETSHENHRTHRDLTF